MLTVKMLSDLIEIKTDLLKTRLREAEDEMNRCVMIEPLRFSHPGFGGFRAIDRHLEDVLIISHDLRLLEDLKKQMELE